MEGMSAMKTVKHIYANVFRFRGLPYSIISNQGPGFTSTVWKHFCERLGIQRCLSTTYHSETDGQSENANQELEIYLEKYVSYFQDDWAK
jgi:transposase InsO family protein